MHVWIGVSAIITIDLVSAAAIFADSSTHDRHAFRLSERTVPWGKLTAGASGTVLGTLLSTAIVHIVLCPPIAHGAAGELAKPVHPKGHLQGQASNSASGTSRILPVQGRAVIETAHGVFFLTAAASIPLGAGLGWLSAHARIACAASNLSDEKPFHYVIHP
ncbi:hypothetical protein V8E36_006283 [Tilletia maclaganii]